MEIGVCVGELSSNYVTFISTKMPKIGEYVILEYENQKVLGIIENLIRFNPFINEDLLNEEAIEKIIELGEETYIRGKIKILGNVENLEIPKIPPPPGTKVKIANKEILDKIFGKSEKSIKIGKLLTNENVEVYLDVNKLVSRHLAILSITGAGKSNTVAILSSRINELGGTILIFDMHSEYVKSDLPNKNIIPTKLNPLYLDALEVAKLIKVSEEAYVQERYLRRAWNKAIKEIKELKIKVEIEEFFDRVIEILEKEARSKEIDSSTRNSIYKVIAKLEDFLARYKEILDFEISKITERIKEKRINIIDLGDLDEDFADIIVSHTLRNILYEWKSMKIKEKTLKPIFIVLEEAHILVPKERETLSCYYVSRIAREGRKFGIGLCLVSQRPKALNSDALSQCNNMIILKIVEPNDQKYIQACSELLTDDLIRHLPSLNVGEAIIIGPAIRLPALVKIDKFEGNLGGADIDIVSEWKKETKNYELELI